MRIVGNIFFRNELAGNKSFEILVRNMDQEVRVLYKFETGPKGGKLVKQTTYPDGKVSKKDFQSTNMISEVKFLRVGKTVDGGFEWPEHMTIALRITPKSQKSKVSFAIVTQFFPECLIESPLDRRN